MTREQMKAIRRRWAIEAELRIMEATPSHHFSGVTEPDILGGQIVRECTARIRELLDPTKEPT